MDKKLKPYKKQMLLIIILLMFLVTGFTIQYVIMPYLKYQEAIRLFKENKFGEATTIFVNLDTYKKSNRYLEMIYTHAHNQYRNGDFKNAKELFYKLEDYKDAEMFLRELTELKKYIGTWEGTDEHKNWLIFNGWTTYFIINPNGYYQIIWDDEYHLDKKDNHLKVRFPAAVVHYYLDRNGNLKMERKYETGYEDTLETFKKISSSVELPEGIKEPQIGMTVEEVKASTWGEPKKINKTTTKYGVSEQWVYYGYKYIYFDNGTVTAIQDSN